MNAADSYVSIFWQKVVNSKILIWAYFGKNSESKSECEHFLVNVEFSMWALFGLWNLNVSIFGKFEISMLAFFGKFWNLNVSIFW